MKGMQKIVRGSGFKGAVSYCLLGEDMTIRHGQLIGGTMSGYDIDTLTREFSTVSSRRSKIEKPVWHSSLRMPKDEGVSDDKWEDIAADYMRGLGWDMEKVQYAVFTHDAGEHIHIVANRVYHDSTLYLGANENLKSTAIIGALEVSHNLTRTTQRQLTADGHIVMPARAKPKRGEMEMAGRDIEPIKAKLQHLISDAKKDHPTFSTFMARLDAVDVVTVPNVTSGGFFKGFAFSYEGIPFKGGDLGQEYVWNDANLKKELDYEQVRDSKELIARRKSAVFVKDTADARPGAGTKAKRGAAAIGGRAPGRDTPDIRGDSKPVEHGQQNLGRPGGFAETLRELDGNKLGSDVSEGAGVQQAQDLPHPHQQPYQGIERGRLVDVDGAVHRSWSDVALHVSAAVSDDTQRTRPAGDTAAGKDAAVPPTIADAAAAAAAKKIEDIGNYYRAGFKSLVTPAPPLQSAESIEIGLALLSDAGETPGQKIHRQAMATKAAYEAKERERPSPGGPSMDEGPSR